MAPNLKIQRAAKSLQWSLQRFWVKKVTTLFSPFFVKNILGEFKVSIFWAPQFFWQMELLMISFLR